MRIGVVTGEYPPMQGGVGAYTRILAQHLADAGQEVFLFSTRRAISDDLPLYNDLQRWSIDSLWAANRWAHQSRLDILNLQFQTAAFGMSPWIHFLPDVVRDIPVVTTFHDLRFPYLFPKAGPLRDWIVMHLACRSTGAIVTNHEDAARIADLPCSRLIPIGSNILDSLPDHFAPAEWRERAGASEGDFLLAFFGLLNQSKGLTHLLESVAVLRSEGIPARLLLIGSAGTSDPTNRAYQAEIDRLIHRLDLESAFHRTGFVDSEREVGSYLKSCDAVVLPFLDGASFRRGSLMAAIHYGCPIITTIPRVTVPEFVPGANMLLVPAGDTSALTQALRQYRATPTLAQTLRAGAARLAARFDWERIAGDYVDFFAAVLGDSA